MSCHEPFTSDCVKQRFRIKLSWELAARNHVWNPLSHGWSIPFKYRMVGHSLLMRVSRPLTVNSLDVGLTGWPFPISGEFRWWQISNIMLCIAFYSNSVVLLYIHSLFLLSTDVLMSFLNLFLVSFHTIFSLCPALWWLTHYRIIYHIIELL